MWYVAKRRFISGEGTFRPGEKVWCPDARRAQYLLTRHLIEAVTEAGKPSGLIPGEWAGQTVAIFAGGPSLTPEDVATSKAQGWKTIAINDSYRIDPDADILYACDYKWWAVHAKSSEAVKSRRVTRDARAAAEFGLIYVASDNKPGLSRDPKIIHEGGNSGYQGIGLAHLLGAARIILLGFDMGKAPDGKSHWFGAHPGRLEVSSPFDLWVSKFGALARDLEAAGVEVINASRMTRLECFPRAALDELVVPVVAARPLVKVVGMHGLGDNIHQRAFIREVIKTSDVWLETPWPNVYHDLRGPNLHVIQKGSRLRTQAKNIRRESADFDRGPAPVGGKTIKVSYAPDAVRKSGSVLAAMMAKTGTPAAWDFRLPVPWAHGLNLPTDRPVLFFRPLQERSEWGGCKNRNPETAAYVALFKSIRDRFFVVSVADFEDGREWCPHEDLGADLTFHRGELGFPQIAALVRDSAMAFTPPGFAIILAQAVGTPVVGVFGGYEKAASFSGGEGFARCHWVHPLRPCDCFSHDHNCDKRIDLPRAIAELKGFIDATV